MWLWLVNVCGDTKWQICIVAKAATTSNHALIFPILEANLKTFASKTLTVCVYG